MTLDFTGKVVVVTGASRGIGTAIATAFAEAGARTATAPCWRRCATLSGTSIAA
jgi:NAD(P)-dependent dehydrogenase (short-subunit alcohol dehydrogenase family)